MRAIAAVGALSLILLCGCDSPTSSSWSPGPPAPLLASVAGADLPFSQPVPFAAQLDNRTCLVGIFHGPQNLPLVHHWSVALGFAQNATIRVEATSVNPNDRGALRATLRDLAGNTVANVEVPYTGSPVSTGDLTAALTQGYYRLSLEVIPATEPSPIQTGQHYKLGASAGVTLGWSGPVHYNEGAAPGSHFWSINAGAGEQVQVTLSVDADGSGVPGQATSVTYEVRNADNTPGPVAATTAPIGPTQTATIGFFSPAARAYILRVGANGHYRQQKTSGGDPGFYGMRCVLPPPQQPPPLQLRRVQIDIKPGSDPNSVNLGKKGLVAVAVFTRTAAQATPDFPAFDATTLDPALLRIMDFADFIPGVYPQGAIPVRGATEDVDGDGDLDLVVHFDAQDLADQGFQGGRFDANTAGAVLYGPVPPLPPTSAVFGGDAVRIISK